MDCNYDIDDNRLWFLLPGGMQAIARRPLDAVPEGMRLATMGEMINANAGKPFPTGQKPDGTDAPVTYGLYNMGVGGLFHEKWFITQQGRVGGALNVDRQDNIAVLRSCFHTHGGFSLSGNLAGNEGYAVVRDVDPKNAVLYQRVWGHVAEHVTADEGFVQICPVGDDNLVYVGFSSRCLACPNQERISVRVLQKAVPEYDIQLLPEYSRLEAKILAHGQAVNSIGLPKITRSFD